MRCWLTIGALLLAASASAQSKLPVRDVKVTWLHGAPKVSFSARDLVDREVRAKLSSGLRKRIVVTVEGFTDGANKRVATRQFSCSITRDLWEEGFVVRIGSRTETVATLDQVLNRCLVVRGLFVVERDKWKRQSDRSVYFRVRAAFNPISKKQCRELIRGSTSSDDGVGPITINIVRRRICKAERVVEFRSRVFRVPP